MADDGNWNIEEIERAFSAAMAERGYGDHHVPANSGWNRFAFPDNRPGRDSGSAILDVGETIVGTVRDFSFVRDERAARPDAEFHPLGGPSAVTASTSALFATPLGASARPN